MDEDRALDWAKICCFSHSSLTFPERGLPKWWEWLLFLPSLDPPLLLPLPPVTAVAEAAMLFCWLAPKLLSICCSGSIVVPVADGDELDGIELLTSGADFGSCRRSLCCCGCTKGEA